MRAMSCQVADGRGRAERRRHLPVGALQLLMVTFQQGLPVLDEIAASEHLFIAGQLEAVSDEPVGVEHLRGFVRGQIVESLVSLGRPSPAIGLEEAVPVNPRAG